MKQIYEHIKKNTISPLLKELGFKKKGNNYYKETNELAYTLNVQGSKWNDTERVDFRINLGIFSKAIYTPSYLQFSGYPVGKYPQVVDSVLQTSISSIKDGIDKWYVIESHTNVEKLEEMLLEDIEQVVMPYFHRFQTVHDVIDELEKHNDSSLYHLALLYHSLQNVNKVRDILLTEISETQNKEEIEDMRAFGKFLSINL
ncbi:DUF4304 domain-containing protein [Metabacillus malikii]|uniref:DUF4304 domain-containing protein n=1 Tax=Metabacillus malikii TaxID=1504265 RepID=A0ABT9ZHV3_9BACI|nr:DUF4304 domain-containing protein [Metabacillus malikii]MDQ0231864.1 hypothetical protein [Metabacillus malikii]